MAGSGRPSSSMAEINTARIEEMIQNDRWVTLSEISPELRLCAYHFCCAALFQPPRPGSMDMDLISTKTG
ncbi:hypothetical protein TNCV_2143781 [Trichonephila clavipes]|nr:hypothetical protein TNCV_2143781 [Trichonephila clavipes]